MGIKNESNYFLTNLVNLFLFFIFDIYVQVLMTKKKSPKQQQQPTEEIQMAGNKDIMIITGTNMKYLSLMENEYGHIIISSMSLVLHRYKI